MINALTRGPSEASFSFLDPAQLQELSPEQRKWAETQFRILYAEQMAKLSAELENQQRIKNNLLNKQKQQDESVKLNYLRLQNKMQGIEAKRQLHYDSKQKAYKLNEQKWTKKISDIEKKFRHQNRQAIQKAQKYRKQSQDFWRNKQSNMVSARGTSYQKFDLNKTQKLVVNNAPEMVSLTHRANIPDISRQYRSSKVATLDLEESTIMMNSETSRDKLKHSRTIDIDGDISRHKERSSIINKQRQTLIFQNAMKRLAKIQMSRKKAQKLKQPSKSPVQIRKPKKHPIQDDPYVAQYSTKKKIIQESKSKDSLINETLQSHIKAKRLIEELEFKERNKILEGEHKRKRQDKILKAIKDKIKDIKSSTVKMQALQ